MEDEFVSGHVHVHGEMRERSGGGGEKGIDKIVYQIACIDMVQLVSIRLVLTCTCMNSDIADRALYMYKWQSYA